MARDIDALTSFTLKHLRDRWWDASFTVPAGRAAAAGASSTSAAAPAPRADPLGAAAGRRALRRHRPAAARLRDARRAMREQGVAAELAGRRRAPAIRAGELRRGVRRGRPAARAPAAGGRRRPALRPAPGRPARDRRAGQRGALLVQRSGVRARGVPRRPPSSIRWSRSREGEDADPSIGPRVPRLLRAAGFEIAAVQLVPVSLSRAGAPVPRVWDERRAAIAAAVETARGTSAEEPGRALAKAFERYASEADDAGPAFLEIQNTMLVVTIAQRGPEAWTPPPAATPAPARPRTKDRSPWLRAGTAGTSTRRSTTGRTPVPWRRDVAFWRGLAARAKGRVLELGCGTGRVLVPVARDGRRIVGIDRSTPMLDRARAKLARARARPGPGAPRLRAALLRGDIRDLPCRAETFGLVMAPCGILQSLTREADLRRTLAAVHRVLRQARCSASISSPTCAMEGIERRLTLKGSGRPASRSSSSRPSARITQAAADHLRPGVHRRPRPGEPAGVSRCRSAPSTCPRCAVASSGPASRCRPSSATTTGARGTTAPTRG